MLFAAVLLDSGHIQQRSHFSHLSLHCLGRSHTLQWSCQGKNCLDDWVRFSESSKLGFRSAHFSQKTSRLKEVLLLDPEPCLQHHHYKHHDDCPGLFAKPRKRLRGRFYSSWGGCGCVRAATLGWFVQASLSFERPPIDLRTDCANLDVQWRNLL